MFIKKILYLLKSMLISVLFLKQNVLTNISWDLNFHLTFVQEGPKNRCRSNFLQVLVFHGIGIWVGLVKDKMTKNPKIYHFWWFLVEITVSCKEYWVHTYGTWCIFFHLPNVKKTWKFHSLPFGGTVLSPPPYTTRPLCTGSNVTKNHFHINHLFLLPFYLPCIF